MKHGFTITSSASLLLVALAAQAVQFRPMTTSERAYYGGTHVMEVEYDDFTATAAGTSEAFTNAVSAGTLLECVGWHMVAPFDTDTTTVTNSLAFTVGDLGDTDCFIASTQAAEDGTEVTFKWPVAQGGTLIRKTYSTATNVVVTVTTDASTGALNTMTRGRAKILFKKYP